MCILFCFKKVAASDRQEIMTLFRKVMYADSEEEVEACYDNLSRALQDDEYDNVVEYFETWWKRRPAWCCAYRHSPAFRGHNTNNYAEVNIRVFKDIGVNRVKQYNAISLMHAVLTTMEEFYRHRLLDFAYNRNRLNVYKMRHVIGQADYIKKECIQQTHDGQYKVPSEEKEGQFYNVDSNRGLCECRVGNDGSFCKHQCGVAYHFSLDLPNAPRITDDDRYIAARVALGDSCPHQSFFASLRVGPPTTAESDIADTPRPAMHVVDSIFHQQVVVDEPQETDPALRQEALRKVQLIADALVSTVTNLEDANWAEINSGLDKFSRRLESCANASQLGTLLHTVGGGIPRLKRSGAMIGVQPTSKARRTETRGRGNRTLSYGRNAKAVSLLQKAKKRKVSHCLSQNIKLNVSNYRKH